MAGTSVVQNNGTMMTWDNQSLVWTDSLVSYRSWAAPYDTIGYVLGIDEDLPLVEVLSNAPKTQLADSFSISGNSYRGPGLGCAESFAVSDSTVWSYRQWLDEPLSIGSFAGKLSSKSLSESLSITESCDNHFGMNVEVSLTFAESILNSVGYIRQFDESLTIAELASNRFGQNISQQFSIIDAWRRAADMVISDMIVGNGDMFIEDFDEFIRYGGAPGYTKWRDFVPGDYEYQEALVRVVLESKNSDRGMLTGLQMSVDVPDLIDRGSATITNASTGITVNFAKTFHIVPEITLATKGGVDGTTLTPNLVSATKTGFVAKMKDQTGAFATGSFTWAAHGY